LKGLAVLDGTILMSFGLDPLLYVHRY